MGEWALWAMETPFRDVSLERGGSSYRNSKVKALAGQVFCKNGRLGALRYIMEYPLQAKAMWEPVLPYCTPESVHCAWHQAHMEINPHAYLRSYQFACIDQAHPSGGPTWLP